MTDKITEARRVAFEAKYPLIDGMYWDKDREQYAGNSLFWLYQDRWETYNAALNSVCVELPNRCDAANIYDDCDHGYNASLDECREAIEQAGVRCK